MCVNGGAGIQTRPWRVREHVRRRWFSRSDARGEIDVFYEMGSIRAGRRRGSIISVAVMGKQSERTTSETPVKTGRLCCRGDLGTQERGDGDRIEGYTFGAGT